MCHFGTPNSRMNKYMENGSQQSEKRIAIPISVIWAIEEALMNPTAWGEKKAIMLVQYLQKERKATNNKS